MVTLAYDNVWCNVSATEDEEHEIMEALSYSVKGAYFTKQFKNKSWNGKSTFYLHKTNRFPTGLINFLVKKCKHLTFDIVDQTPYNKNCQLEEIKLINEETNKEMELRDFQMKSIQTLLDKRRGIIDLPTRAGKTVIGIALTQALNVPTLFIVPTKGLFSQTQLEYKRKIGIETGAIGDSKFKIKDITVAMPRSIESAINNLNRRKEMLEYLYRVRFIIFDEVHRVNKTYSKIAKNFIAADYRIGLSATPFSSDKEKKMRVQSIVGPVIYKVEMKKLVKGKYIAKPIVTFVEIPKDRTIVTSEWSELYYWGIVNNPVRNSLIAILAMKQLRKGKRSLILIEKREHGEILLEMLENKANVEYLHGGHTLDNRDQKKSDFESGKIEILITSRIFNEGINIPFLESVIIGGGYKSGTLLFQRYGRGITKTEKKKITNIFDFIDPYGKLNNHSKKRISLIQKNDAFEIKFKTIDEI